ncbi:alpha/beta fold hydrolase [Lichenifustis flavocetrariae]
MGIVRTVRKSTARSSRSWTSPLVLATFAAAGALAASAVINRQATQKAERDNPPTGRFLDIEGVRLHYVERGTGEPLVLLHGNGSMIQDFETSGLVELAARTYRVIVFDRPGYGYSERPRSTVWTADAQADLIHAALQRIGVKQATVLGHSWGASVAVALGLRHPEMVGSLVLASGYYYPTLRADVVTASGPAVPILGDLMRYTVSPLLGRMMWPLLLRKLFGPSPTPTKFDGFPVGMALRPSQIRAGAAESALLLPDAFAARAKYVRLKMPVAIIAGEEDRIVDIDRQSQRLHDEIAQSTFDRVPGVGHMVHQSATERVMAAIDLASEKQTRTASTDKVVPFAAKG